MIGSVLDHLWQSTLFLAGAGLLTLALRRNSAQIRFWLWFAASLKFLIPFVLLTTLGATLLSPALPPLSAPALVSMQPAAQPFSTPLPMLYGPSPVMSAPLHVMPTPAQPSLNLSLLLLLIWGAGFVVIMARWSASWLRLRRILRGAADFPLVAPLAVKLAPSSLEPGLVGIWRPVILLPQGVADRLSRDEMDAIMAHEICHFRRRDNLLAAMHMLVEALFWFYPLVWWLGARLNAERERACDESVLASGRTPQVYAESILKICKLYLQSPLGCVSGVSGADLKRRIETIMENNFSNRLNAMKKVLLATCAAAAILAPVALGLLTAPQSMLPALAQAANAPHPGTEAALRHQIESMEKGQADYDVMVPQLAQAARAQSVGTEANIQKWGALKSIAFRENENNDDVYVVEFENQLTAWTIGPVQSDGKIGPTLFFGPAIKRDGNGPSPGLKAAIQREVDGDFTGNPALEIMSPALQRATQNQWKMISTDAKNLGAMQTIGFQKVNARGWDVYHVTFTNGTETIQAAPLTDGQLSGILHTDIAMPHEPQRPGTEAWLRRHISAILNGAPNYDDMGPFLANAVRREWARQGPVYKSLGVLQSLAFEGGGANGTDVYLATFQNGKIRWHIEAPDADGKLNTLFFQKVN